MQAHYLNSRCCDHSGPYAGFWKGGLPGGPNVKPHPLFNDHTHLIRKNNTERTLQINSKLVLHGCFLRKCLHISSTSSSGYQSLLSLSIPEVTNHIARCWVVNAMNIINFKGGLPITPLNPPCVRACHYTLKLNLWPLHSNHMTDAVQNWCSCSEETTVLLVKISSAMEVGMSKVVCTQPFFMLRSRSVEESRPSTASFSCLKL